MSDYSRVSLLRVQKMCEALLPIDELKNIKWSVIALVQSFAKPGTYESETAINAARGIQRRLDWVIANLQQAGEGKQNLG
jgi:hypothetical protein